MAQRLPQVRYDRGAATAQSSAKESLLTIMENLDHLEKEDPKGKHARAAKSFLDSMNAGETLTPNQLSYVDGILERCYKGAGWETPGLKIDRKRRQLKF